MVNAMCYYFGVILMFLRIVCIFIFFILHTVFYFLFKDVSLILVYLLTVVSYTLILFVICKTKGGGKHD